MNDNVIFGKTAIRNQLTYVGVQSWKAAHLPTLEIRVEQGGIVPVVFELYEASNGLKLGP